MHDVAAAHRSTFRASLKGLVTREGKISVAFTAYSLHTAVITSDSVHQVILFRAGRVEVSGNIEI